MMVTSDIDILSYSDGSTPITLAHCDAVRRGTHVINIATFWRIISTVTCVKMEQA